MWYKLRTILSFKRAISPYPAETLADLELEEKVYKADFEISSKFQSLSKELVRISLLGLGVYGFLLKIATDTSQGEEFLQALRNHRYLILCGTGALALCAAGALVHGFLSNQCLGHQLVISRYFGRLEGSRWNEHQKEHFREEIRRQQSRQRKILILGNGCLLFATLALIVGAALIAICSDLMLFKITS